MPALRWDMNHLFSSCAAVDRRSSVKEAQTLLEQIRNIDGDFEFETYYSLSCHNCPDVVQALNLMAAVTEPAHQAHGD